LRQWRCTLHLLQTSDNRLAEVTSRPAAKENLFPGNLEQDSRYISRNRLAIVDTVIAALVSDRPDSDIVFFDCLQNLDESARSFNIIDVNSPAPLAGICISSTSSCAFL
jgi:hypothetical protein